MLVISGAYIRGAYIRGGLSLGFYGMLTGNLLCQNHAENF